MMLDQKTVQRCFELYSPLQNAPRIASVFEQSVRVDLSPGATVFAQGDACPHFLLVLAGAVRVFSRSETGREVLLYRVRPGDTCVLTTSCLLGGKNYPAEGVTEGATEAVAIPFGLFQEYMMMSAEFRECVFGSFGRRLVDLIGLVEGMHSGTIEMRLARVLLAKAGELSASQEPSTLETTHQELAFELGSAREVVSRQLKVMEKSGCLRLSRGKIHLMDLDALADMSDPI